MKIQKPIDIQLVKKRLPRPIDVVQYDTGVQLVFTVTDFDIPTGTTATMYAEKPSGRFVYQETGITVAGNVITIDLENQAVTEHGDTWYQVSLENGGDSITTFAGILRVEKSRADSGAVESKTVIAAFEAKTAEQIAVIEAETLEQIATLQAASQTEKNAIEDKGIEVLATIPEDYTATAATAEKAIREKADAIVCKAIGESVVISDASDDHLRGLKLFGKTEQIKTTGAQMFDKSTAVQGMLEENGNIISDASYFTSDFIPILPKTAYHQTAKDSIRAKYYDANKNPLSDTWDVQITTDATFTTFENAHFIRVTVSSGKVDSFMLNIGTTGLPYEPYSGGKVSPNPEYPQVLTNIGKAGNIAVSIYGKNLSPVNTVTVENHQSFILEAPLPIGEYAFQAYIESNDTDGEYSTVVFMNGSQNVAYIPLRRGNATYKFTANMPIEKIDFCAAYNYSQGDGDTATWSNIQLEYSDTASDYEDSREKQTITLLAPDGLPGIPVPSGGNYTDANGQQWICDEIDIARGVYVRRVGGYTFTESDSWTLNSSGFLYAYIPSGIPVGQAVNLSRGLCGAMPFINNSTGSGISVNNNQFRIGTAAVSAYGLTAGNAAAKMAGQTIIWNVATPSETPLTAELIEAFKGLHSNKPITTILNDGGVTLAVSYNADTKAYIDNKIKELM